MMNKIAVFSLALVFLVSFSCKQENAKTKPVSIPECLQQQIKNHQSNYPTPFDTPANITKYLYKNQEVYIFDPDPAHSHIRDWVYKAVGADCVEVCNFGGGFANLRNTCPDFEQQAVALEVVWIHQ